MDLGLLYKAIEQGQVDMIAANATDGVLSKMDLKILEDDRHAFPGYQVSFVAREALLKERPEVAAAMQELAGKFSNAKMQELNYSVDVEHKPVGVVAEGFWRGQILRVGSPNLLGLSSMIFAKNWPQRVNALLRQTVRIFPYGSLSRMFPFCVLLWLRRKARRAALRGSGSAFPTAAGHGHETKSLVDRARSQCPRSVRNRIRSRRVHFPIKDDLLLTETNTGCWGARIVGPHGSDGAFVKLRLRFRAKAEFNTPVGYAGAQEKILDSYPDAQRRSPI